MSDLHGEAWLAVRKLLTRYDGYSKDGLAIADGVASAAVDAVLRAIEASGRVTVDRARFERLLDAANMAADEWGAESRVGLHPGDLDPLP